MRKTLGVCLLTLLLTCSAVAGEMPNLSPAPPPQPQTNAMQDPTDAEQEQTGGEMPNPTPDSLTQTVLDLLALLPRLL